MCAAQKLAVRGEKLAQAYFIAGGNLLHQTYHLRAFAWRVGYGKPSAKAPVIHPGDEAPFLVWGGEGSALQAAMRRLTEAGKPAMLGIDVLAQDKA